MESKNFIKVLFAEKSHQRLREYFIRNQIITKEDFLGIDPVKLYFDVKLTVQDVKVVKHQLKILKQESIGSGKFPTSENVDNISHEDIDFSVIATNEERIASIGLSPKIPAVHKSESVFQKQSDIADFPRGFKSQSEINLNPYIGEKATILKSRSPVFQITIRTAYKNVPRTKGFFQYCSEKNLVYMTDLQDSDFPLDNGFSGISTKTLRSLKNIHKRYKEFFTSCINDINDVNQVIDIDKIPLDYIFIRANKGATFIEYLNSVGIESALEINPYDFQSKIHGLTLSKLEELKGVFEKFLRNTISSIQITKSLNDIHPLNFNYSLSTFIDDKELVESFDAKKVLLVKDLIDQPLTPWERFRLYPYFKSLKTSILQHFSYAILDLQDSYREVLLGRGEGKTFEELAEELHVTRQRIQQIEYGASLKLLKLIDSIGDFLLRKNKGSFSIQMLDMYLLSKNHAIIFKCISKYSEIIFFQEVTGRFYPVAVSERFSELPIILNQLVGDSCNYQEAQEEIFSLFKTKGWGSTSLEELDKIMHDLGFKKYGPIIAKKSSAFQLIVENIIYFEFPFGISFAKNKDMDRLRTLISKQYNYELEEINNRALGARIQRFKNIVLWDSGTYIHIKNVELSEKLFIEIAQYVEDEFEGIQYSKLFNIFKSRLLLETTITNPHALHGVLGYFFPDFEYSLGAVIKKGRKRIPLGIQMKNYISTNGGLASLEELKNEFGVPSYTVDQHLAKAKDIVNWGNGYYKSLESLGILAQDVSGIEGILSESLSKMDGYTSIQTFYLRITNVRLDLVEKLQITNRTALFNLAKALFASDFIFHHGLHIAVKGFPIKNFNKESVIRYFLTDDLGFRREELEAVFKKLNWLDDNNAVSSFINSASILQISLDEFIWSEHLTISKENLLNVNNIISSLLDKSDYFSVPLIKDYSEFPEIGYSWNEFLITSVIRKFEDQLNFKLIELDIRSNLYCRSFVVPKHVPASRYSDLIKWILEKEQIKEISEAELFSFLSSRGLLINERIPTEVYNNDFVKS